MRAIRMLADTEGSPNGHTVYIYTAGEVYSADTTPPVDAHLMRSFVASKRAVDVDATTPAAARRETKPTGPKATK